MASSSTRSTRCHNIAPFDYIFIIGACRNPVVAIGIPDETHAPTNRPLMMTHRIASSAVTGIPRITNLRQRRRRRLFCHNSIKRSIERELKHTTTTPVLKVLFSPGHHHHRSSSNLLQCRRRRVFTAVIIFNWLIYSRKWLEASFHSSMDRKSYVSLCAPHLTSQAHMVCMVLGCHIQPAAHGQSTEARCTDE